MNRVFFPKKAISFFCTLLLLSSATAHASLIEMDLLAAGDKLITFDTTTSLQWLDLSATLGQSYNDAESSSYATTYGFHHASASQLRTLFVDFGIVDFTNTFAAANQPAANNFISALSCTVFCGAGNFSTAAGFIDSVPFSSSTDLATFVQSDSDGLTARVPGTIGNGVGVLSKSDSDSRFGNFMIRESAPSIPEPATLALLSVGLFGMSFRKQKKTRCKAGVGS